MNILVTGGSSGLGKSLTEKLAASHPESEVYFSYFRSADAAQALESSFPNAHGIQCDFGSGPDLDALIGLVRDKDIRVLVNNALPAFEKNYFHKMPIEAFENGFHQNLLPVIRLTQGFLLKVRKDKWGKLITILSSAITNPGTGWGLYTAEKMYLQGLSRVWAKENIAYNISVNTVSPG